MLKSSSLCLYSSNLSTFWLKIKQFWPFEEGDSGQVWFKLAQWFQRRRFFKKFTDGRQVMAIAHTSELKGLRRTTDGRTPSDGES
jgi:hypothetical protein